jgi:hypothetical protein
LVFTASRRAGVRVLWHQPLDSLEAKPLPGTESAVLPFWSPDSRSVAFYSEVDKKLKKVDLSGGPAVTLCPARNGSASGAWLANGSLIFYDDTKLMRVPATGGEPKPLFGPDVPAPKMAQLWPRALPDGKHIYFSPRRRTKKVFTRPTWNPAIAHGHTGALAFEYSRMDTSCTAGNRLSWRSVLMRDR